MIDERALLLQEVVDRAREDAAESHRAAMNSYGAGYDAGYLAGLTKAIDILSGRGEDQ